MNMEQVLASIADNYPDEDIRFLVNEMSEGKFAARKQLADLICNRPAKVSPAMICEISKWGINDNLSLCPDIRAIQ